MAQNFDSGFSLVEYMSDHSGYLCGYCKSPDTNYSHGMWAHKMAVHDYQDLIDRGWRRSGKYCYKPTMDKTCCPHYTIKCDALNFKLSKSQKKVLKRMNTYLSSGKCPKNVSTFDGVGSRMHEAELAHLKPNMDKNLSNVDALNDKKKPAAKNIDSHDPFKELCSPTDQIEAINKNECDRPISDLSQTNRKKVKAGAGPDPSKPPCKKAKLLRREKRTAKNSCHDGNTVQPLSNLVHKQTAPRAKSLEDYLKLPSPEFAAHRLEIRLVMALPIDRQYRATVEAAHSVYTKYQMTVHKDPESKCTRSRYERFLCKSSLQFRLVSVNSHPEKFATTFKVSHEVFRTYQIAIHHDSPGECTQSAYKNFLVDGPLTPWNPTHGPPKGYGPFHQQYWLDGKLIAVAVLDILPHCISSVYFFYDPEYSFLSLGTYSSLREIALTRELHQSAPLLKWYYMGYYIHSCPKMRYKANYFPSLLLCPETYVWVPIPKCLPKLDQNKYSRLNDDTCSPEHSTDISQVRCLYNGCIALYREVANVLTGGESDIKEYLSLVGAKIASSLLLYRD